MATPTQLRPGLRSTQSHSHRPSPNHHPLGSSSVHPSLTRRTSARPSSPAYGLMGAPLAPSVSLPATQHLPSQVTPDSPPPAYHPPHAKTISTARPSRRVAGVSEADLLGVGTSSRSPAARRLDHAAKAMATVPSIEEDTLTRRPYSPRRTHSGSSRRTLASYLDSLSRDDMAVVDTRFDLMSDDELQRYMQEATASHLPGTGSSDGTRTPRTRTDGLDGEVSEDDPRAQLARTLPRAPSPLFPPSPPSLASQVVPQDHPLRVLSRAVRELREVIDRLEGDNEQLRRDKAKLEKKRRARSGDRMSIHDGLTEAISTSLTSDSPMRALPSTRPLFVRASSPTPSTYTTRSHRPPSISSSISVPFPSSPMGPPRDPPRERPGSSGDTGQSTPVEPITSKSRSTWTSGLWVWSTGKKQSKGRNGSQVTATPTSSGQGILPPLGTGQVAHALSTPIPVEDQADIDWMRDGRISSPAFRAIFLATRIITPDPSSILASADIPSNSLIAYLAHSLVSNARDEGIIARDPAWDRSSRRSRDISRGRAASIVNRDDATELEPSALAADGRTGAAGYGDQALAATASLGRTLFSSVSNATIRGTRAITLSNGDESRPSLLKRASSGRGLPTTAISSAAPQLSSTHSGSSATSPTEERPLPSVELASIVPDESRPPTVLLSRQNLGSFFQASKNKLHTASRFESDDEPLTDRYGFIYDIQHAKMLKAASVAGTTAPMSLNGSLPPATQPESEGWIARRRGSNASQRSTQPDHPSQASLASPRQSIDSTSSANVAAQPRVRTPEGRTPPGSRTPSQADPHRHRSSTLLSLNPSTARPVTAQEHLTVSARGSSSLQPGISASATTTSLSASLAHTSVPVNSPPNASASRLTISSLLDQLTEIHDRQQQDRQKGWDAFLRRRARHRATASTSSNHHHGSDDLRWGSELIGIGQMGLNGKGGQEDWKMFTRLVRKGIPLKYRSDVWAECSGAKDLLVPGEYAEILTVHRDDPSPVQNDIEKDVSRTFPGNVFFGGDGPGVAKLRRVLTAYSWHNPAVGYCQGMNMLAATLLLTHTDEEQAYWVLTSLIDRLLPPSFYSPTLLASRADQQVLSHLVVQLVPKVHAHLDELGVDLASVTFGWWLSLFTDCLPVETLFRVWDVFFVEGHDTLFRVAIAILKLNESEMCATESVSDLFAFISSMTSRLWNADKLIALQHSYKPIIRHIDLVARCEKAVTELQREMGEA
ncbi:hypothetical protein IAU60_004382 [Kwoniella sp. DSM 27419]